MSPIISRRSLDEVMDLAERSADGYAKVTDVITQISKIMADDSLTDANKLYKIRVAIVLGLSK